MNRTSAEQVRALIGEAIPSGGSAADTMFTDAEIEDFLELGFTNVRAAAYYGWIEKAANYSNLVNVNEGNAARELGELHRQALRMAERFIGYVPTPSRGRARIGNITRQNDNA
jgi:hypothetical protein